MSLHVLKEFRHIPSEIIRQYPDKIIDIQMERRQGSYVSESKPFSGQGQRLGEIVPAIVSFEDSEQRTSRCANQASSEFIGKLCMMLWKKISVISICPAEFLFVHWFVFGDVCILNSVF